VLLIRGRLFAGIPRPFSLELRRGHLDKLTKRSLMRRNSQSGK
jgi:hypothetical protein